MKFISCHIENFGKLTDFSFEFSEGTNVICEENGWGKSTFAAFIRAMFYGLAGEKKRSALENERKKYKPWQGGVFGGQLIFQIQGKQYQISRIFHEKELNDEFELRDVKTNLLSKDYSKNIGEEIFQIDRESFLRPAFIGQSECETSTTDDINAKIGNLTDNANDLNNFDAAHARLTEIVNALTPSRASGALAKRREEIARCERIFKDGEGIPERMEIYQERVRAQDEAYNNLKAELEEVGRVQEKAAKRQSALAKESEWKRLKNAAAEKKEEQKALRDKFPGRIPELSLVKEQIDQCGELAKAFERMSLYRAGEKEEREFSSLADIFENGVPGEQEIEAKQKEASQLLRLKREYDANQMSEQEKARLSELASCFLDEAEDASFFAADWARRNQKKAALPSNEAAVAALQAAFAAQNRQDVQGTQNAQNGQNGQNGKNAKSAKNASAKGYAAFLVIGILLAAAGIVAGVYSLVAGFVVAVIGVGMVLVGLYKKEMGAAREGEEISRDRVHGRRKGTESSWDDTRGRGQRTESSWNDTHGRGQEAVEEMQDSPRRMPRASEGKADSIWEADASGQVFGSFGENPEIAKLRHIIAEDTAFIEQMDADVAAYLRAHGRRFEADNEYAVTLALQEIVMENAEYQALKRKAQGAKADARTEQIYQYQESIEAFLYRYGVAAAQENYTEELYTLKERAAFYAALAAQREKFRKAEEDYERIRSGIAAFYEEYGFAPEQNISLQLGEIRDAVDDYEDAGKACERAERELKQFEEENDISVFLEAEGEETLPSLEEIHGRILALNEEMEQVRTARTEHVNMLEDLRAEYDEWEENRVKLEQLRQAQEIQQKKYELVTKARAKLGEAKEAMTAKYAAPILAAFSKYYEMIAGTSAKNFHVDANTQVTVEEYGKQRETEMLSRGRRDLAGICLRIAFADAMYPDEAPVLIMDDPFTNLDDDKIAAGKRFLSEVAKKYQIVYFTCSEARA